MIAMDPAAREAWTDARKEALKTGRLDEVLKALAPRCESPGSSYPYPSLPYIPLHRARIPLSRRPVTPRPRRHHRDQIPPL